MTYERIVFFVLAVLFVWLIIISFVLFRIFRYFRKLSEGVKEDNFLKLLDKILADEKLNSKAIENVRRAVAELEDKGKLHIQNLGIIRFNPFKELGGDHSFSLALLDGKDTGIVITGLHTRERTRVYVKEILKGKSKIMLSKEEAKALKMAQKRK